MTPLALFLGQRLDFFPESEYANGNWPASLKSTITVSTIKRAYLNYSYWDPLFLSL